MMHAASGKPTRARNTGHPGGDCGPGAGRRWARGIALDFCKLFTQTRELFIRAHDLFVGVRQSFIGARDRGIVGFSCFRSGCGVHWRFPLRPMSSDGGSNPGSYGDSVPESLSAAQPNGAAPRRLSPSRRSFPLVLIYLSEGDPRNPSQAKHTGGPGGQVYAPSLHERTTIIYPDGDASPAGM